MFGLQCPPFPIHIIRTSRYKKQVEAPSAWGFNETPGSYSLIVQFLLIVKRHYHNLDFTTTILSTINVYREPEAGGKDYGSKLQLHHFRLLIESLYCFTGSIV